MRQTSLQAYTNITNSGVAGQQELLVLQTIKQYGPITDLETAHHSALPINCVTGRRNALTKKGLVIEAGTKKNHTGHTATQWTTPTPNQNP